MTQPEFDRYSDSYTELLKDPIRDYFCGAQPAFFHLRKRDLICDYFRRRKIDTRTLRYLDLGCGKGDLLRILRSCFGYVAGCDLSSEMIDPIEGVETHLQTDESKIPFPARCFDFVTAAGVYHHVPLANRAALAQEVRRVLKPGGVFAVLEHNPLNPVTRLIVSRTPIDVGAVLLTASEAKRLMRWAGLTVDGPYYFLYLPMRIYERRGRVIERLLTKVPLGGQYAMFGIKAGVP
jgi:SAM-dependent methyltransferase